MRLNLRIKIGNYTLFGMISKTQRLEGITSKVENQKRLHYIFWDLENCTLDEVKYTLTTVQHDFALGDIFITGDIERSYRAWCFSERDFQTLLHILLHTEYLDYNFFYWTVQRSYATLRTSNKQNREPQKILAVLKGFEKTRIPNKFLAVNYDTGIEKKGVLIKIG